MNKTLLSLLSFIVMWLGQLLWLVESAYVFDVYRMFQFDKGAAHFGSQRATVNLFAATVSTIHLASLSQYILIVPVEHFNQTLLEQVLLKKVGGLLMLLPMEENQSDLSTQRWSIEFEHSLLTREFNLPIYFAFRTPEVERFYNELLFLSSSDSSLVDKKTSHFLSVLIDPKGYRLVANTKEPKPLSSSSIYATNLQGWLAGVQTMSGVGGTSTSSEIRTEDKEGKKSNSIEAKNENENESHNEEAKEKISSTTRTQSSILTQKKPKREKPSEKRTSAKKPKQQKKETLKSSLSIDTVLPTIVIVAYYDTFGIAPELAKGANANGSGVVALLELARLFNKLYRSHLRTIGRYNLLFLLTSADSFNFMGTKYWLENVDEKVLESIEFVLALDTIVGSTFESDNKSHDRIYLHVSRPPKEEHIKRLYSSFTETAKVLQIPFEIIQKKINISSPDIMWQHEHFSRKKIVAGTLSHFSTPLPAFSRSHLFDNRSNVNISLLQRNIRFVAEALCKYIYGVAPEVTVFDGSLAVNSQFVDSWLSTIASFPRVFPFLDKNHTLISGLENVLSQYTSDVSRQVFVMPQTNLTFYTPTKGTMTAFRSKPLSFDIILSFFIATYIILLYTALKGPKETWKQVKSLFSSTSKHKSKRE